MGEVNIPFIHSLIVVDSDGDRLLAKYYDGKPKDEQLKYEATLHKKSKALTAKTDAEIVLVENELVALKSGNDCRFYVSGPINENDLILVGVLDTIFDSVSSILKGTVDKKSMLDSMELVLLIIDETIDHGYIFEIDSSAVVGRVTMRTSESIPQSTSIGDLTISQALGLAREQFMRSLTSSRGDGY
mmetsp:Transcript_16072/g.14528  ORF Transcript_16072/g.14528 Transcript_16072/m.14528 type:complete len:187 (+) Transcript_16072:40-600(+)